MAEKGHFPRMQWTNRAATPRFPIPTLQLAFGIGPLSISKLALSPRPVARHHRTMPQNENVATILRIFDAIERRDDNQFLENIGPAGEIHWPASLPYGGSAALAKPSGPTWTDTWDRLQPTAAERAMNPRIVAANEDEVVVLWRQRGLSPAGERFDQEVLALYQLREGKLRRAQMFYFDASAVAAFLARSSTRVATPSS